MGKTLIPTLGRIFLSMSSTIPFFFPSSLSSHAPSPNHSLSGQNTPATSSSTLPSPFPCPPYLFALLRFPFFRNRRSNLVENQNSSHQIATVFRFLVLSPDCGLLLTVRRRRIWSPCVMELCPLLLARLRRSLGESGRGFGWGISRCCRLDWTPMQRLLRRVPVVIHRNFFRGYFLLL